MKKDKGPFMKKLYIWGAGDIGRRLIRHFDEDWEIIFADSDKKKKGSSCCGREVISIEEYIKDHSDEFIIIANLYENECMEILRENHVINYFVHCDLPGEFKEPCGRDYLKNHIIGYLGRREDYILYGLNLYSIVIDEWIYKRYGIHPAVLAEDDVSSGYTDKIKRQYPGLNIIESMEQTATVKEICVCTGGYTELKKQNLFKEYRLTDIFDCTDKIENYYNPKIEAFHNIHKGKRCFIVATGPSLKMEDLDLLNERKEICFSMNSIFYAFNETDWRPDFYVASDYRIFDEYKGILERLPIENIFLNDTDKEFWKNPHINNFFKFHQHYEYCFDRFPKFSDDFSRKSYIGATVTYTCMQLAVYMGFKEIYLLGVDFSYGGEKKNTKYSYFHKPEKTERTVKGFVKHVTLAYQSARRYTDTHGIKIFNATRGGKLEVFERVDFDSLF